MEALTATEPSVLQVVSRALSHVTTVRKGTKRRRGSAPAITTAEVTEPEGEFEDGETEESDEDAKQEERKKLQRRHSRLTDRGRGRGKRSRGRGATHSIPAEDRGRTRDRYSSASRPRDASAFVIPNSVSPSKRDLLLHQENINHVHSILTADLLARCPELQYNSEFSWRQPKKRFFQQQKVALLRLQLRPSLQTTVQVQLWLQQAHLFLCQVSSWNSD